MTVISDILEELEASWDDLVKTFRVFFPEPKPKPKPKLRVGLSGSYTRLLEPGLRRIWTDIEGDPRNMGPHYPGKIYHVDKMKRARFTRGL